jgi:hypothetical protein
MANNLVIVPSHAKAKPLAGCLAEATDVGPGVSQDEAR